MQGLTSDSWGMGSACPCCILCCALCAGNDGLSEDQDVIGFPLAAFRDNWLAILQNILILQVNHSIKLNNNSEKEVRSKMKRGGYRKHIRNHLIHKEKIRVPLEDLT